MVVSGDLIVAAEPPAAAVHRSDPKITPAVRVERADVSGDGHAAVNFAVTVDLVQSAFGRCGQQGSRLRTAKSGDVRMGVRQFVSHTKRIPTALVNTVA